ncbi:MAG: cadmium-translocating P-type ATPase [Roseburia sp.]|nr:cadmium-translocating P-type ATPase [Anaeroplasma bactoclasticum]MCM1196695.1 cadmium-translocating P-type ATPase [Roseburia sp.]MCM1556809.1 cadmium-translocating P-type ATPase [Anaeroplasma bactoclasticum]
MTRRQKRNLIRICITIVLFIILFTVDHIIHLDTVIPNERLGWIFPACLYLVLYLVIAYDVLWKAIRNICHGQVFDENFLMCVASIGAFCLGIVRGVTRQKIEGFDEAVAVILFYQVGEFFQGYAVGKSRKSISSLMDIRPDFANVLRDGKIETVEPDEVELEEIIVVKPGERVPLDGIILNGSSTLDTKALTGESLPREVQKGDEIISGCVNLTQTLQIQVKKAFYDSTVSKILDLVENASSQKSKAENFITKFAKYYTPIVVILAVLLALIPGLITKEYTEWIYRALNFLVVSCPCALVISIPLSFFAGIGVASKLGILIKGSNYLEKFNKVNTFVFDKTGTLTKGNFAVTLVLPENKREEILELAAIAEGSSNHPIAKSILDIVGKVPETGYTLTDVAGHGIIAVKEDISIYCGNEKLMESSGIEYQKVEHIGTVVYIAKNKEFIGSILISDEIKEEAPKVIKSLNDMGNETIMLTGDNEAIAKEVASKLGVTSYKASLLPQNKVEEVENLLSKKKDKEYLSFVGDGINDAPVLMRSDIGISMGGVGSDAAIEASDIVLMKDDLKGIGLAKKIAKKTMRIVFENIIFALGIKILVLILSALGYSNMWLGVFADVGVAILAILNAMRCSSIKE